MTIKFCVFGEGKNDIGKTDLDGAVLTEGCYASFTKKAAAGKNLICVKAARFPKKFPGGKKRKADNKLKGFIGHGYLAAREAATMQVDWLIIGTDADKGELCRIREEFETGYDLAIEKDHDVANIKLIALVPLVKLESWLLADEKAFKKVAGFERGKLPKNPEEMHGQTDPKDHLDKLFTDKRRLRPDTEILRQIARQSSPEVLKSQCKYSYTPFFESVIK
jgi:hypothetical protein